MGIKKFRTGSRHAMSAVSITPKGCLEKDLNPSRLWLPLVHLKVRAVRVSPAEPYSTVDRIAKSCSGSLMKHLERCG